MIIKKYQKYPFYCTWAAVAIFIFILIFQPATLTFQAVRPSDVWLWFCLFMQYERGHVKKVHFKGTFLLKNYGLYMGMLAILSTIVQAQYAGLALNISFLFHFYRFFRFLLIFIFIKNIVYTSYSGRVEKLLRVYAIIGGVILLLGFLEYHAIQPFQSILVGLYYQRPDYTLWEYLEGVTRLAGVMGNSNATAIVIVTTTIYPLLCALLLIKNWLYKLIYVLLVALTAYALFVMLGSRTAVLAFLCIPLLTVLISLNSQKKVLILSLSFVVFFGAVPSIYQHYGSNIVVQNRISSRIIGTELRLDSIEGFTEWTGRQELWQDRLQLIEEVGSPLALIIGLGYTKAYKDYADNGLLSSYINSGLIGLFLKLLLYYKVASKGITKVIRRFRKKQSGISELSLGLIVLVFMFWDLTADMTEHYKIGQLYYVFLSITTLVLHYQPIEKKNEITD